MLIFYIFALIPFYLIGCFPTGLLVAKHFKVDITKEGSGNVGATNVARTLGKKAGLITLTGDILKGVLAVLIAKIISPDKTFQALCAVAAVLGHTFPYKLPHGKGVATTAGTFLVLTPAALGLSALTFAAIFLFKRIVSLSSITAALTLPIFCMLTASNNPAIVAAILVATIVTFRHKDNLIRLSQGKEPKFSSNQK